MHTEYCRRCGEPLTALTVSLKAGECVCCRIRRARRVPHGESVVAFGHALRPAFNEDVLANMRFEGFWWGHANVCPLG